MPSVTDLKVLGPSAVTRAAYEASKALGGHRLTFRPVSGAAISAASPALQLSYPDPDTSVAQRCLNDARAIIEDGVLAFGRRTVITSPLDWTRTGPDSSGHWADGSWWTIDIRSGDRAGDVKWTWEWGRHRDLVVLARASTLEPGNEAWIGELDRLLTLWLAATPLEKSVHWYSNLELALRAIAWDQVLQLTGSRLRPETTEGLLLRLTQIRRHLWRDLPYTVSSMRNNHLLGDSLGMMTVDRMLGISPSGWSTRWARRLFANQLERQFAADGSMVEDSLSYHRFVLEMLATAVLIGERNPRLMSALRDASNHLIALGALDGGVPQYGDWDEGRVLTTSGDPLDVAGSALLGLALSGERLPSHLWDEHDLLAWYAPRPESATSDGPCAANVSSSGGLSRAVRGHWNVWLKSGSAPSHGHADLGHVSARVGQEWLLSDPGTGTYNGPIEVRNGFRTSSAHNALVIDGEDQLVPHRAFRWVHRPWTAAGSPIQMGDSVVLWGVHDAYARIGVGRVARAVLVGTTGCAVIDWVETGEGHRYQLTLPLGPSATIDGTSVQLPGSTTQISGPSEWDVLVGSKAPFAGWSSSTYGSWEPTPWLRYTGTISGPVTWSVGMERPLLAPSGELTVGELSLALRWSSESVALEVTDQRSGRQVIGVVPGGSR